MANSIFMSFNGEDYMCSNEVIKNRDEVMSIWSVDLVTLEINYSKGYAVVFDVDDTHPIDYTPLRALPPQQMYEYLIKNYL